jgi:choline dehydrogenase-like flavoprotein
VPGLILGGKRSPEPNTQYCNLVCALMKPISRGSVHLQSPEFSVQPRIDPDYLGSSYELEMLKLGVRKMLQISETESWKKIMLKSLVKDDLERIKNSNPDLDESGVLGEYCRERAGTTFHFVGTAAMLPRENGGVVDSRLKVYGTENLRVVCLIFPVDEASD